MTTLQSKRWTEIRFFYTLENIKDFRNDMQDAMDIIQFYAMFSNYSAEYVQRQAVELMQSNWMHPARDEVIVLSRLAHWNYKKIIKVLHVSKETYYGMIKITVPQHGIMPRLANGVHDEIQKFLTVFERIGGTAV
jgi:hypothetical protein